MIHSPDEVQQGHARPAWEMLVIKFCMFEFGIQQSVMKLFVNDVY